MKMKSTRSFSNEDGTSLRQMTITESFKKAKPIPFKMEKPYEVSDVIYEVDSETDVETPHSDYDYSPGSVFSNNSDRTIIYENTFDCSTVEFGPPPASNSNEKEELILNDPKNFVDDTTEDALDGFPSVTVYGSPLRFDKKGTNETTKRRLSFNMSNPNGNTDLQNIESNGLSAQLDIIAVKKPKNARKPETNKKTNIVAAATEVNNSTAEQQADSSIKKPENGQSEFHNILLNGLGAQPGIKHPIKKPKTARKPRTNNKKNIIAAEPQMNNFTAEQQIDSSSKKPKIVRKPRGKYKKRTKTTEDQGNKISQGQNKDQHLTNILSQSTSYIKPVMSLDDYIASLQKNRDVSITRIEGNNNTNRTIQNGVGILERSSTGWRSKQNSVSHDPSSKVDSSKSKASDNSSTDVVAKAASSSGSKPKPELIATRSVIPPSERSEESVDDLANDLETLLRSPADAFSRPTKPVETNGRKTEHRKRKSQEKSAHDKENSKKLITESVTNSKTGVENTSTPIRVIQNIQSSVTAKKGSTVSIPLANFSSTHNTSVTTPNILTPKDPEVNTNVSTQTSKKILNLDSGNISTKTLGKSGIKVVEDGLNPSCSKFSTKKSKARKTLFKGGNSIVPKESPKEVEKEKQETSCSDASGSNEQLPSKNVSPTLQKSANTDPSTPKKLSLSTSTPKKLSLSTSTAKKLSLSTSKKLSPLKGSPGKSGRPSSPIKHTEIKSLKAKEGKQLQVQQLNELDKLFKTVNANRHLKSLLNRDEINVLTRFLKMEENQRYVVMKLCIWKKAWYNIFKFCSKARIQTVDDKDILDIFQFLREENFVDTDYKTSVDMISMLHQLNLKQVKEIMGELGIKTSVCTKENMIQCLLTATSSQLTLTTKTLKDRVMDKIEQKLGFAIKINDEVYNAIRNCYLLATFTNRDFEQIQDFFRYMVHLRIVFPVAPIDEWPVFFSRDKFLKYAAAVDLRRELDEALANKTTGNKCIVIYNIGEVAYGCLQKLDPVDGRDYTNAPHLKRFSAEHVLCGVLSRCCEKIFTKRNGKPEEVKKWLEYLIRRFPTSSRLGKWYHSLIWLHMRHLDNIDYARAAQLLCEVLDTKRQYLTQRAPYELGTLGKKLKSSKKHRIVQFYHDRVALLVPREIDVSSFKQQQIDSVCIRGEESGKKRVYITKNMEGMTMKHVEQVALDYYAENGYPGGECCEGSLVKALLMLLFWDIIHNRERLVPGTFISSLQSAPLDMFTKYFYENRKDAIDERLRQIAFQWSQEKLIEFGSKNYQEHSHETAAFGAVMNVIKDVLTVEVLITVIGRKVLARIFERLIKDLGETSSGMPDLLIWNVDRKIHKFVEVKGEGDKLAQHQLLWLNYLQEKCGASVEVCWVHSTGSKRKKITKVLSTEGFNNGPPTPSGEEASSESSDNDAG